MAGITQTSDYRCSFPTKPIASSKCYPMTEQRGTNTRKQQTGLGTMLKITLAMVPGSWLEADTPGHKASAPTFFQVLVQWPRPTLTWFTTFVYLWGHRPKRPQPILAMSGLQSTMGSLWQTDTSGFEYYVLGPFGQPALTNMLPKFSEYYL